MSRYLVSGYFFIVIFNICEKGILMKEFVVNDWVSIRIEIVENKVYKK